MDYPGRFICITGLVCLAGGFAPSIEAPPATYDPQLYSANTGNSSLLPTFLGRHNATVTVHAGDTATLACHVLQLGDKTVTWARRKGGNLHLLTVGLQGYYNDNRFTLSFEYPNNWKLQIKFAQKRDEGMYQCQVSTHPPRSKAVFLKVTVPTIEIRDPRGEAVSEAFYRVDSTVGLQCVVVPAPPGRPVLWFKEGKPVTTQPERGIRVDGSLMGSGITSWLHIARAAVTDSGNYTCRAGEVARADVRVHVLDEETSAGLQHPTTDGGTPVVCPPVPPFPLLLLLLLIALALS